MPTTRKVRYIIPKDAITNIENPTRNIQLSQIYEPNFTAATREMLIKTQEFIADLQILQNSIRDNSTASGWKTGMESLGAEKDAEINSIALHRDVFPDSPFVNCPPGIIKRIRLSITPPSLESGQLTAFQAATFYFCFWVYNSQTNMYRKLTGFNGLNASGPMASPLLMNSNTELQDYIQFIPNTGPNIREHSTCWDSNSTSVSSAQKSAFTVTSNDYICATYFTDNLTDQVTCMPTISFLYT